MRLRAVVHRRCADERGRSYVYAANSAAIFALDPLAAEALGAFDREDGLDDAEWLGRAADRAAAEAALHDLVDLGVIRPLGEAPPPRATLPPMPFPVSTLVLNVTNRCNLSCTYCYEYGADRLTAGAERAGTGPARMDDATAKRSIDFLLRSSADRPQVTITFFGGETLLNFPAIRAAVEYAEAQGHAHKKRVHFALTTNATLLDDEVVDFLTAHRFGVTVSIDGAPADQDRHRTFRSGDGTFATIAPKIRRLVAANRERRGRPIGARVTLTAGAQPIRDTFAFLVGELGFDDVGFAPVTAAPGRSYSLDGGGYAGLLREFAGLAEDYVAAALRNERHGFSNLHDLLRELHQGVQKAHPCGAGLGLVGVATDGEIGLCHRFVESKAHAIGHVDRGLDDAARSAFLQRAHVDQKTDCTRCFARPLCAGGCYHEAHVRLGDAARANLHHCEWIRGFVDLGLSCYARILSGNPRFLARFESA